MAKLADRHYLLDPWRIIEEGFDAERNTVSESVFSLANEYMGVRGYAEEGISCESMRGSYFNGVYENAREEKFTSYKGIVTRTHFMINAVDWLYARIRVDGELLDTAAGGISQYRRELDMRSGTLRRSFVWRTAGGREMRVSFERFLSMRRVWEGFQRIELTPLNFSGEAQVEIGLDFSNPHYGSNFCYWEEKRKACKEGQAAILAGTLTTGERICSAAHLSCSKAFTSAPTEADRYAGADCRVALSQGESVTFTKHVTNLVEKDAAVPDNAVWEKAATLAGAQKERGYEAALRDQQDYWRSVWDSVDITIEGDQWKQQGIRFCIFQLQQTYHGANPADNVGAKGLTGESYNGHTFWDTESYCLPFFLFNNPAAAKNLLEYRYSTLPNARKRAKELDCSGACYPVATLTGDEACDLWQHASIQFQPSTAVAYAVRHYALNTGDKEFLYSHGVEMLVEISRFLLSRGAWSARRNQFGFYAVMGPDEFHMMVNNNCYTNYLAKKTFEYTLEVVETMKNDLPQVYETLRGKLDIRDEELRFLRACADSMILPFDPQTGVYEQHEGFFDLPHCDINAIPVTDFPLYSHWSYDHIYRTDMIKQPDVLMMMFLFSADFSAEAKRKNYEYYEPRTIHESSLSPSIHSILASELHKPAEAFRFFDFATRMDLDNYNRNTSEGLHTTSLAAAWVNIVYGFGGLRSDTGKLTFAPSIPPEWDSYSFRLTCHGSILCVRVGKKEATFRVTSGNPVPITVYGTDFSVDEKGIGIPLQNEPGQA
jgi:Trehalose and maltose hydrolases (possible phosphorylases)